MKILNIEVLNILMRYAFMRTCTCLKKHTDNDGGVSRARLVAARAKRDFIFRTNVCLLDP